MMKVAILLGCLALGALAVDYEGALKSSKKLLHLYDSFSTKQHKVKSPERLRIFRDTLKEVVQGNLAHPEWQMGINKFSDMTVDERRGYLGLNITGLRPRHAPLHAAPELAIPASVDWRAQGKVTGVKDQGNCGSCWCFGAVGPIETNYAIITGKRKQFAEQEYVDSVKTHRSDACHGGWSEDCWLLSGNTRRLAILRDAPYKGRRVHSKSHYTKIHNGLIAATVTGYTAVPDGENHVLAALAKGSIEVAFEVTNHFFSYTTGVMRDRTCDDGGSTTANHAVTAVGYTTKSMIIKNSWGANWGMGGYFETARGTDLCEYFRWGASPDMIAIKGKVDNDPDFVPTDDDDCKGKNADGCACGTVRCGDGICRHAHMC